MNFKDPIICNDFKDVYSPSDDSYLVMDYLKRVITDQKFDELPLLEIKKVLDLGTGTGIIAVFLEMIKLQCKNFQSEIFASDVNPNAIECAKKNEKLNNLDEGIYFIKSNLFESFPKRLMHSFNIVIFNPPYLPSIQDLNHQNDDSTWNGGDSGVEIIMLFFNQVKYFLSENGLIYFVCSSNTPIQFLLDFLTSEGFYVEEVDRIHFFFEDIILNKARIKI